MDFLKKLFGMGGTANRIQGERSADGDRGLYFYVQPRRCKEIVRVRIDPMNDLSEADEGGYVVRKIVRGSNCPFQSELTLRFSSGRALSGSEVADGELVTKADYDAWLAEKEGNEG